MAPKAITLSLAASVSLCSDTPPASGCRPAPLHCQPETSACFSDPEGQASSLRPPIGALPPSATILPPIRGLMNSRILARGTRFIWRRGQDVGGFDCSPHPERGFLYGFRPLIPSVACIPYHRRLRAFLAEAPLLSASAKKRFGLRVERLRPPACHPLFPDTAPASRGRARMSAPAVINSLWRLHSR